MTRQNIVVSGQWSVTTAPTDASCPANFFANITDYGSGSFYAANGSVLVARNGNADSSIFEQTRTSLVGKLAGNELVIALNAHGNNRVLTGTISADASTMSGSYRDSLGGGTWTAQKRSAVTGTYTGTFTSNSNLSAKPILLAADISQDEGFAISGSAVFGNSSHFSSLKFGPGSRAVGGAIRLLDSSNGVTLNLIPNEDGKLSLNSAYYANYAGAGDVGTGTVNATTV